jgi:hypothetical protein
MSADAEGKGTVMAGRRRGNATDLVFEGVVIPRHTRSAKIAAEGITNEDDMGRFLTAVFSDTLNGKIVLPKPGSRAGVPSRILNGAEQKLRRGLPVTIQPIGSNLKKPRKSNANQLKARVAPLGNLRG